MLKIATLQNILQNWEQLHACLCVLVGERSVGIVLVFSYDLLESKGKGKMQ